MAELSMTTLAHEPARGLMRGQPRAMKRAVESVAAGVIENVTGAVGSIGVGRVARAAESFPRRIYSNE